MSIGDSDIIADVDICIDTGADFTLCDNAFLKNHFGGKDALIHIYHPTRLERPTRKQEGAWIEVGCGGGGLFRVMLCLCRPFLVSDSTIAFLKVTSQFSNEEEGQDFLDGASSSRL